jgi:tetratricopeptide (TPR) repeat protein
VYRVSRVADGRLAAIKVAGRAEPESNAQLRREAEAMSRVGPPFVPEILATGMHDGRFFVAMDVVEGPTLADRLVAEGGAMPLARFGPAALAILEAVEAVHRHRLVHRDLKPENVFVLDAVGAGAPVTAKIIDFGSVRIDDALLLQEEAAVGTPEYMAPEQCDGKVDVDARADVYALAILFYEMLTGAPPFWGNSADVREGQRARRPPRPSAKIPQQLSDVILECLAKDARRRLADAGSFRGALVPILARAGAAPSVAPAAMTTGSAAANGPPAGPMALAKPASAREKRTVSLLYFQSTQGTAAVQRELAAFGAQLAHASGTQFVATFGHEVDLNPVRRSVSAGNNLVARGHCAAALVEVGQVSVQVRADGGHRFFSALFSRKDRFPGPDDKGILLTAAARELVPELAASVIPDRTGVFRLERRNVSLETTSTISGPLPDAPVGRDDVLHRLAASAVAASTASTPTLVTVLAEPGHGKTLVARTLADRLERLGIAEVLLAAGEESMGTASPSSRLLLARCLDLPPQAPPDFGKNLLEQKLKSGADRQAWVAASLILGWAPIEHPEVRALSAAPGALRAASSRAVGEALRLRARGKPVLLLFDDANLADDATLDALEYATLEEAGAPIWVCVFCQPMLEKGRPTWGRRAAASERHVLEALPEEDAVELARRLLRPVENVPKAVLARLVERTRGVPHLLVELVAGLKREGLVRRAERGTGCVLATEELERLPDLPIVQWSASREIEKLPQDLASHARLASVLGGGFTVDEVDAIVRILERKGSVDDVRLDSSVAVDRLVRSGMLVRRRKGAIDFRHDLLRETVYRTVPDTIRQGVHAAAFEMYARGGGGAEALARLALHASRCGMKEQAASAYMALAEQARARQAYLEGELMYGRALEHIDDAADAQACAAAHGRGLMRVRLSRLEDALKDYVLARERARRHGGDAEREILIMSDEASAADWMRDFARLASLARDASAASRALATPSKLVQARVLMVVGLAHHRVDELEEAVRVNLQAAAEAESLGDAGYETFVVSLVLAGFDAAVLGKGDEAEGILARAIEAAEQRGDVMHLAGALNNRAPLWYARGDVDRFFQDAERILRLARDAGLDTMEYAALHNLGETEYLIDRLESAREHTLRAADFARRMWGSECVEACGREVLLARIRFYGGEVDEARALVDSLEQRFAGLREAGKAHEWLSPADQTMFDGVALATRGGTEAEWDSLLLRAEKNNPQVHERMELLELRGIAEAARGDAALARRHLEQALRLSPEQLLARRVESRLRRMAGT